MREIPTGEVPPEFSKTLRAKPSLWTKETVVKAFGLSLEGSGLAPMGENLTGDYFAGVMDTKEG